MKRYFYYNVKKSISIEKLVTLEYLELKPDFYFPREAHPFCELVYIENGDITCCINDDEVRLNKNNLLLIKANTTHSYRLEQNNRATVFIICFKCNSEMLNILDDEIVLNRENRQIMSKIFDEARKAFKFPFDEKLSPLDKLVIGGQQLVENYIEELIIKLCREKIYNKKDIKIVQTNDELWDNIIGDIKALLSENLYNKITLTDVSKKIFYSKTLLNNTFKKLTGTTIMSYYTKIKIEESKKLLKSGLPLTEISELLNFESPNYFSKVFKRLTGLTPAQYRKSVKQ